MTSSSFSSLFAVLYVAMYAGHTVADHWLQTDRQATCKALPGWQGRRACGAHVAVLTVLQAVVVAVVCWRVGARPDVGWVCAGLGVNAASHYWADRRSTLAGLAKATGKGGFYGLGDGRVAPVGTGAYAMDHAWHVGWVVVSVLVMCG